jgi:L-aspartate oxidase
MGADVTLDLRHLDPVEVHRRFPTVAAICAGHGLDLARDPIPVTPAAHYAIGGVLTDMAGRSTLPGLFAIGECAATGAHGANRLASNGLLEAAVMAAGAAEAIAGDMDAWPRGPVAAAVPVGEDAPATRGARRAVQAAMWDGVGVQRDAAGLAAAAAALDAVAPGDDLEAANLLLVARLTAAAADIRTESRGAHHRSDHPLPDPAQARRIAWAGGQPYLVPDARRSRAIALEAA